MKLRALLATVGVALASTLAAAQQPLPPGHPTTALPPGHPTAALPPGHPTAALPPGHPTTAAPPAAAPPAAPTSDVPPGHPPVDMPPGHPPMGANPRAAAGSGQAPPPVDSLEPVRELAKGSIEAVLLDADERPIAGADVRLGIMFNKISEGESRSERHAKTGPDGVAHFSGLTTGSNYSYRITTKSGPAEYASAPFDLKDTGGMRAVVHVFAAIEDIAQTLVGIRGIYYIETRDDVFSIEGIFRVMNLGRTAWAPKDVVLPLPEGFKAFSGGETMFDARFEPLDGRGAKITGTFPPGQRDINFRFQVPKESSTTAVFRFGTTPRTVEIRVIAVANNAMGLDVEGFEATQSGTGPSGDHVLVTRKAAARGSPELGAFVVTLTGLSVPGPGRWIAILIALGVAGAGGLAAAGKWRPFSGERIETDRARACDLLLDELVLLTGAKERGEIGPETHEQTRRTLLDALSRIGLPSAPRQAKRTGRAQRA